jgi:hypothetical protein
MYVLYIRYVRSSRTLRSLRSTSYNLSYYSSSYSSIGSILDRAYINQLASSDSSLSSYNIVLKASVTNHISLTIFIRILAIIYITLTKLRYITNITYRSLTSAYKNITIYYRLKDNIPNY